MAGNLQVSFGAKEPEDAAPKPKGADWLENRSRRAFS
jgi:hypothetical protein